MRLLPIVALTRRASMVERVTGVDDDYLVARWCVDVV
jgi:hypothetical protein